MALANVVGLDHIVIVVRDLDGAAAQWRGLGFTVSPRGTHSAHMGTGNYTIMLGEDYVELLGVLTPTERNAPTRAFLDKREGIERAAFTAVSAGGLADELKARGLAAIGPVAFARPVPMADGSTSEARFETTQWPIDQRPGGLRIFACQHLTRETVWLPELVTHANTATRIDRVEILSLDPKAAAAHMTRLIDQPAEAEDDGALRVPSGGTRGDFVFLDRATLERRHPGVPLAGLPEEGAVTLALRVADDAAMAKVLSRRACVAAPGLVKIAPAEASGVILELATG